MKTRYLPQPERAALLATKRAHKMARSAHAYVRGSTEKFYEWIDTKSAAELPPGPAVWICGDCHVGNLGPVGGGGEPIVELRDLDQTVVGNPAYDLVRLALSLAMAARGSDLGGVTTARMTEDLVAGYERAFEGEQPSERIADLPRPVRVVMKRATRRTWKQLSAERLDGKVALPWGRRYWPLSPEERRAVAELVATDQVRELVTRLVDRDPAALELIDAAYWVKGCSSLGLWRAAVLLRIGKAPCLLDIKEAADTFAPRRRTPELPADPAQRVVAGARRLAPMLGERMVATTLCGRSVFVRELLPQDLKVELDTLSVEDVRGVAFYFGMVVGRAHSRQLDRAGRAAWHDELRSQYTKTLDAPSWLWRALVDLVAVHERAYLEHCRRFALTPS